MNEEIREKAALAAKRWNSVVDAIELAKENWDKLGELLREHRNLHQGLGPRGQKMLTVVNRNAKFDVMLERLISWWMTHGGISELRIEEVEIKDQDGSNNRNDTKKGKRSK